MHTSLLRGTLFVMPKAVAFFMWEEEVAATLLLPIAWRLQMWIRLNWIYILSVFSIHIALCHPTLILTFRGLTAMK